MLSSTTGVLVRIFIISPFPLDTLTPLPIKHLPILIYFIIRSFILFFITYYYPSCSLRFAYLHNMHIIYTLYNWWSKRVIRTTNSSQQRRWRRWFRTQRRRCLIKHCFGYGVVVVVVSVGVGVGINSIAGAGVIGNWIFRLLSATVALRKHCTCMYSSYIILLYTPSTTTVVVYYWNHVYITIIVCKLI